jgi:predicted PurR-regulated permease PerM
MASESWHLARAVPVTIILSVLVQTVVFVVFLTTLSSDVASNSEDIDTLQTNQNNLKQIVQGQEVTLGRIDENIKAIKEFLENASGN